MPELIQTWQNWNKYKMNEWMFVSAVHVCDCPKVTVCFNFITAAAFRHEASGLDWSVPCVWRSAGRSWLSGFPWALRSSGASPWHSAILQAAPRLRGTEGLKPAALPAASVCEGGRQRHALRFTHLPSSSGNRRKLFYTFLKFLNKGQTHFSKSLIYI